jgi:hypothetical protein
MFFQLPLKQKRLYFLRPNAEWNEKVRITDSQQVAVRRRTKRKIKIGI